MTEELQNSLDESKIISMKFIGLLNPLYPSTKPQPLTIEVTNHGRFTSNIIFNVLEDGGWTKTEFLPEVEEKGIQVAGRSSESTEIKIGVIDRPVLTLDRTYNYNYSILAKERGKEMARQGVCIKLGFVLGFEVALENSEPQVGEEAVFNVRIRNQSNADLQLSLSEELLADTPKFDIIPDKPSSVAPGERLLIWKVKPKVLENREDEVRVRLKAVAVIKDGKEYQVQDQSDHLLSTKVTWKRPGPVLVLSIVDPLPDELAPGDSPVLKLKIRNQSGVPHEVRLTIDGGGSDWFTLPSEPVKVGARGEQEVDIPLKVPTERNQALAGNYALKVQAASQTDPQAKADAPVTMTVKHLGEATITPELRAIPDDQTAEYQLHIENDTNARLTLSRSASQTDTSHEFTLDPAEIEVSPKETGKTMNLTVKRAEAIMGTNKFTFEMRREFHRLRDNPATDVQHVSADWPPPPQLTITDPHEQEHVLREVTLRGTFQNVPIGMHMWLYIYAPVAEKYWLKRVSTNDPGGIWEAQHVVVGSDDDFGKSFKLGVILANSAVNAQLEAQSDGLEELPDGVQKFHPITVIRELRLDDAIPEMVAYQTRDFKGDYYHECKGSGYQQNQFKLVHDGKWVIDKSFKIKSGFWCIWPGGPIETFEILGPGEYENKKVCRCRAIPTQGITLFEHTYFSGKMINLTHSEPNLGQSHDFNNKASSAYGATGNWLLYEHANYEGKWWSVKEWYAYPNFPNNGLNDLIRSVL